MPKISDKELKNSFLEGDEQSFRILVKRYHFYALRIARAAPFFFSGEDAEDVVQEVMLALYDKIKGVDNIRAFVAGTAHNKCVDIIRKRESKKRRGTVSMADMRNKNSGGKEEESPNPLEDTDKRIDYIPQYALNSRAIEEINKYLEGVGKPCGPLIKRRYFNELSYKELGKSLDIPENQVGVRLSRCLARLAKSMESDREFWGELEELLEKGAA